MAGIEIRPLSRADELEWRRLWTLYLDFYETVLDETVYASTFDRLLSGDQHEFSGLIALVDGRPSGITHYLFHRTCWSVANTCYLQDLYVDEALRGTGLGRALIEAVYARADAAGCPKVYWHTQEFNAVGRRLYDRVADLTPFIVYEHQAGT